MQLLRLIPVALSIPTGRTPKIHLAVEQTVASSAKAHPITSLLRVLATFVRPIHSFFLATVLTFSWLAEHLVDSFMKVLVRPNLTSLSEAGVIFRNLHVDFPTIPASPVTPSNQRTLALNTRKTGMPFYNTNSSSVIGVQFPFAHLFIVS